MSHHSKKLLLIHLAGIAGIFVPYYAVLKLLGITCPIKAIIGKACPTCGMTRAMLSLLRFDINGYIHYNPMALFVVIAVLLMLHRDFFKKKRIIDIYAAIVLTINTIYYIFTVLL